MMKTVFAARRRTDEEGIFGIEFVAGKRDLSMPRGASALKICRWFGHEQDLVASQPLLFTCANGQYVHVCAQRDAPELDP